MNSNIRQNLPRAQFRHLHCLWYSPVTPIWVERSASCEDCGDRRIWSPGLWRTGEGRCCDWNMDTRRFVQRKQGASHSTTLNSSRGLLHCYLLGNHVLLKKKKAHCSRPSELCIVIKCSSSSKHFIESPLTYHVTVPAVNSKCTIISYRYGKTDRDFQQFYCLNC
jgi:hypothetical protein